MFFIFRPYSEQKSYIRIYIFVISSVPKLKNNTDEKMFFIFRPYGEKSHTYEFTFLPIRLY